jgi:hypothetical protein
MQRAKESVGKQKQFKRPHHRHRRRDQHQADVQIIDLIGGKPGQKIGFIHGTVTGLSTTKSMPPSHPSSQPGKTLAILRLGGTSRRH